MVFYCMILIIKDKVMKKLITILTIVPLMAFANLNVEKVTNTLSNLKGNKTLSFFNANKDIPLNGKLNITSLSAADIVLFSPKKYKSKMTIVNAYKKLKVNKNSIGAIYLKKGRTQIVFIKERLDSKGLHLSSKFNKYILHEWQLNPLALAKSFK